MWEVTTGKNVTGFTVHHTEQAEEQQNMVLNSSTKPNEADGSVAAVVFRFAGQIGIQT